MKKLLRIVSIPMLLLGLWLMSIRPVVGIPAAETGLTVLGVVLLITGLFINLQLIWSGRSPATQTAPLAPETPWRIFLWMALVIGNGLIIVGFFLATNPSEGLARLGDACIPIGAVIALIVGVVLMFN